jgi:LysR family transcriptional regulator for bpeEF and oprC
LDALILVPALDEFYARYLDIELMLGFGDKPIDLIQEGVDCVVRVGTLEDSSLVARRIGTFEFVTAASPSYLRMYGEPMTVGDLPDHVAVNYFSARTTRNMNFVVDGKTVEVRMNSKLAANDADAYLNCGIKGLGLGPAHPRAALPSQRRTCRVLAQCKPLAMPISAVYPHHRHLSPPVRAFVDWIAELFERCPLLIKREDSDARRQPSTDTTMRARQDRTFVCGFPKSPAATATCGTA